MKNKPKCKVQKRTHEKEKELYDFSNIFQYRDGDLVVIDPGEFTI